MFPAWMFQRVEMEPNQERAWTLDCQHSVDTSIISRLVCSATLTAPPRDPCPDGRSLGDRSSMAARSFSEDSCWSRGRERNAPTVKQRVSIFILCYITHNILNASTYSFLYPVYNTACYFSLRYTNPCCSSRTVNVGRFSSPFPTSLPLPADPFLPYTWWPCPFSPFIDVGLVLIHVGLACLGIYKATHKTIA